jgi:outer membrane immunogenic protein
MTANRIDGGLILKSLKLALLSTAIVLGAASASNAADIYNKGPSLKDTPVDYLPAIGWTGFYVGVNAGAAFDNTDDNDTAFVGGFQLGYNWQLHSPWVVGIEGDVDFSDGIDYLATIRGRLGYSFDKALLYGTGGAAFIGFNDDSFNDNDSQTGYVVGGGLDYKLTQNVSVGVEGLYYNFDDNHDDNADFWTVRARLNYHFNRGYDQPLK